MDNNQRRTEIYSMDKLKKHDPKKIGCTCSSCCLFIKEMMESCEMPGIDVDIFHSRNLDDTKFCQHDSDTNPCQKCLGDV